jgi:hypothetical protein
MTTAQRSALFVAAVLAPLAAPLAVVLLLASPDQYWLALTIAVEAVCWTLMFMAVIVATGRVGIYAIVVLAVMQSWHTPPIGGLVPELWGAGLVSYSSILLSAVGAFVGLWIGYNMG